VQTSKSHGIVTIYDFENHFQLKFREPDTVMATARLGKKTSHDETAISCSLPIGGDKITMVSRIRTLAVSVTSSIIKGIENYGRPASLFSAGGYSGL
jgi:hypothetical protein